MNKLGRKYILAIELNDGDEAIIIEPPITISFNVVRSSMATINSMLIRIHNLSKVNRNRIFQDRFNPKTYKSIILYAGYDQTPMIFKGNIFQAFSYRQGTEIITMIDARDGIFDTTNAKTNKTMAAGTTRKEIISALIGDFTYLDQGKLSEIEGEVRRPIVISGNTFDFIRQYSEGKAYIDLETVNMLDENDVIEADVPVINSETGLIGTPKRENAYLEIETIFEPGIIMGQQIEVSSEIASQFDGQYKVIGVEHSGVISETIGGTCRSKFSLLVGSQLFGGFNQI